jgi:hypothetical protein
LLEKVGQPAHRAEAGGVINGSDVVPRGKDRGVGDWLSIVQVGEDEFADTGGGGERLFYISLVCGESRTRVNTRLSGQRPHPWATLLP